MMPGECYQMDWGFINAVDDTGKLYRLGCFALVCAHCNKRYIEFFTNARQENLFIGMIHGFQYLGGIPQKIMPDNMKSVVTRREQGEILWNPKYRTRGLVILIFTRLIENSDGVIQIKSSFSL